MPKDLGQHDGVDPSAQRPRRIGVAKEMWVDALLGAPVLGHVAEELEDAGRGEWLLFTAGPRRWQMNTRLLLASSGRLRSAYR